MFTLLLLVIYIAYIGLGLPDSLFGTAWPAIYPQWGLPISHANFVTIINCMGTTTASMLSARIIKKLGTGGVTALSTALTAVSLLGISYSQNFWWICILSLPLGLGAGAIDTALNNYVATHYSASHMSFLHCFYGVGITVSPYIMSLALSDNSTWQKGYRLAFFVQLGITLVMILALPLWKKVKTTEEASGEEDNEILILSYKQMLGNTSIVMILLAFMTSCALEAMCNIWGATYLVDAKGFLPEKAASLIMFYYIGFTLGRFLSGVLANKLNSWFLTCSGISICGLATIIILLPLPGIFSAVGLCLMGFGVGPIFPNLTHLTPIIFGKKISQSVIGAEMAMSYVAYMGIPFVFGLLARNISIHVYPWFVAVIFATCITCIFKLRKKTLTK